ncbi:unnamed protein product [Protopolystoma xenopodis]|uniref:PDZ domain-containing protein n=1 Tax=Protopolystoma xenopodis TaxID=117903 RepID=A0A448XQS9_9PLAT|nr:unnamed protein product [Protopolystoma xenopodis]
MRCSPPFQRFLPRGPHGYGLTLSLITRSSVARCTNRAPDGHDSPLPESPAWPGLGRTDVWVREVRVHSVAPGSPAYAAHLPVGALVVSMNGQALLPPSTPSADRPPSLSLADLQLRIQRLLETPAQSPPPAGSRAEGRQDGVLLGLVLLPSGNSASCSTEPVPFGGYLCLVPPPFSSPFFTHRHRHTHTHKWMLYSQRKNVYDCSKGRGTVLRDLIHIFTNIRSKTILAPPPVKPVCVMELGCEEAAEKLALLAASFALNRRVA